MIPNGFTLGEDYKETKNIVAKQREEERSVIEVIKNTISGVENQLSTEVDNPNKSSGMHTKDQSNM